MPDVALDYALPGRRRRRPWMVLVLMLAACSVGVVAKLCWTKFIVPLREQAAIVRVQERAERTKWEPVSYPDDSRLLIHGTPVQDKLAELFLNVMYGSRLNGTALFFGPLGDGADRRYLLLALSQTDSQPVSSLTLVARTFTVGTTWSAPRETRDAQIMPLLTFRRSYTVEVPARSDTNRRLLYLAGVWDDQRFAYELLLDGDDRVHLVEDTSTTQHTPETVNPAEPARR